jgi:hypothetical protein
MLFRKKGARFARKMLGEAAGPYMIKGKTITNGSKPAYPGTPGPLICGGTMKMTLRVSRIVYSSPMMSR